MKAITISAFDPGMQNIQVSDVPTPKPGPGQVLVKMHTAPINPSDFNFIRGDYLSALNRLIWNYKQQNGQFNLSAASQHPLPEFVLGGEGCGTVVDAGSGFLAKRLKGKRVAFFSGPPHGSWAEYAVVDAKKAVPVAASLTDEQAAMYLVNPLSSYLMLFDVLKVQKGKWLLQTGAGSALGKMVIKLALLKGVKTINVVRNSTNVEALKAIGADVVIATDTDSIQNVVAEVTQGKGVDYVMDCIGGDMLSQSLQCLTINGHAVVYGTLSGPNSDFYSRDLMMPCAKISGFFAGNWMASKSLFSKIKIIKSLAKYSKLGVFETPVAHQISIQDIKQGIQYASEAGQRGKTLIRFE